MLDVLIAPSLLCQSLKTLPGVRGSSSEPVLQYLGNRAVQQGGYLLAVWLWLIFHMTMAHICLVTYLLHLQKCQYQCLLDNWFPLMQTMKMNLQIKALSIWYTTLTIFLLDMKTSFQTLPSIE